MNNELNITGLKHGVIIGAGIAILGLLLIMIGRDTYLTVFGLANIGLSIAVLVYFGRHERNEKFGGYLNYKAAFIYCSIVLFISGNISSFTNITICSYVDSGIQEVILEQSMETSESALRMLGTDEKEIDEGLDEIEASIRMSFSYYSLLTNSWAQLLSAIFFGSIVALFIRKSKPDFVEE